MGKPTDEELKEALAEAARMREAGEDPHHLAKALLNCHFRLKHAEKVYHAAQEYFRTGMEEHYHSKLVNVLEEYRTVETHPVLTKD
ncbi:MAG: hypothetical protein MI796_01410 [Enterobacterales bacterium]|nr:hypothetical protein [Enterobacterales bacterium]